mmetsp:Transcript_37251/g.89576  ORF Transcript_37251/g.89576 Transcript_37251/m.89576 type:complete len:258 (-) Transcript_37251:456-1229(-)
MGIGPQDSLQSGTNARVAPHHESGCGTGTTRSPWETTDNSLRRFPRIRHRCTPCKRQPPAHPCSCAGQLHDHGRRGERGHGVVCACLRAVVRCAGEIDACLLVRRVDLGNLLVISGHQPINSHHARPFIILLHALRSSTIIERNPLWIPVNTLIHSKNAPILLMHQPAVVRCVENKSTRLTVVAHVVRGRVPTNATVWLVDLVDGVIPQRAFALRWRPPQILAVKAIVRMRQTLCHQPISRPINSTPQQVQGDVFRQ